MRKVAIAARPLATAKAICKDYAALHHSVDIDEKPDASDVQALRVQAQKRQGGIIARFVTRPPDGTDDWTIGDEWPIISAFEDSDAAEKYRLAMDDPLDED